MVFCVCEVWRWWGGLVVEEGFSEYNHAIQSLGGENRSYKLQHYTCVTYVYSRKAGVCKATGEDPPTERRTFFF